MGRSYLHPGDRQLAQPLTVGGHGRPALPRAGQDLARFDGLDALRGIAILCVMAFHASIIAIFDLNRPGAVAKGGALFGWMGVDLFFVLSGFLITRIALQYRDATGFFASFWTRRGLRIVPAYFVFLFVMALLLPAVWPQPGGGQADASMPAWSYWLFLSNIFMAVAGDHGAKPLSVTWSLAVEMQFYLLWPPVVRLLSLRSQVRVIAVLLMVVFVARAAFLASGGDELAVFVSLPFRCDSLLAGALIAAWMAADRHLASPRNLWFGFVVAATLLAAALASGYSPVYANPVLVSLKYSLVAGMCFCLVGLAVVHSARFDVRGAPFATIGKYSYALYLWHYAVMLGLAAAMDANGFAVPATATVLLLLVAGVTCGGALAGLSWVAVERPALGLKRFAVFGAMTGGR